MHEPALKKSIIVFSSLGGGGHVAAAEAIKEALSSDYDVHVHNALSEVFNKIDLISKFSNKKWTAEDWYNFFLKKRFFLLANFYGIAGRSYIFFNKSILVKAAKAFLLERKPKMVFSVIPFFNGALFEACQELSIPFWIVPTDVELKTFLIGLKSNLMGDDKFKLALAYAPQIKQAQQWGLLDPQILSVGFPVKKACVKCYEENEISDLKKALLIHTDTKVITLTLGATGTSLFFKIIKSLLKLEHSNLELNCCAGKDLRSYNNAKNLLDKIAMCEHVDENRRIYKLASGSRLHLWGFTTQLPELMAVSDLIVSKSGSLSVSEALHLNKYLLLDHTLNSSSRFLYWERVNLPFVKSINKGEGFYSKKDLLNKIEAFLSSPKESSEEVFLNIHQTLLEAVKGQAD